MLLRIKEYAATLLHWSEKYTKVDMRYLTTGGFWTVIGQISASFIALGLAVAMGHFVPKDIYGNYKYVLAFVAILSSFSLSGLSTSVFQSVSRGYRSALAEGFKANLLWSAGVFFGAFVAGGYYLLHGNMVFGFGILFGGCSMPFLTSYNLYTSLLSGEKDFKLSALYGDVVTNIIPAVALTLAARFAPTALVLLVTYFLSNIAAAAYAYQRSVKRYPNTTSTRDTAMITYGKHLSAMNILSGIAGNIDQIFLFHFSGAIDLAIYNFAIGVPDQLKGPLKNLDTMTQARFVTRETKDIHQNIHNKMLWLFASSVAIIVIYFFIAPLIFKIFFPVYLDAIPYSELYAVSLLAMFMSPAASYLSAKKKVKELYLTTIVNSFVQIAAMLVGVVWWGLLGLIVARVFLRIGGTALSLGLYYSSVRKELA